MEPVRKYVQWGLISDGAATSVHHGLNTSDVIVACYNQSEPDFEFSLAIINDMQIIVRAGRGTQIDKIVVMG